MADLNLDLSGIKPLISQLGLGQSPVPAVPINARPLPPMPPPPTPAQAGFSLWNADPKNQQTIANSLTMPGTPITPPNVPPASPLSASPAPPPPDPAFKPLGQGPENPLAAVKPLPTMAQDMAANPSQYQKPTFAPGRGIVGNGLTLLASGLAGAAGGLGNKDPLAGINYVDKLREEDAAMPAANANTYDIRNVKPLRDAMSLQQASATLAHTNAETGDIAEKSKQQLAQHGLKQVTDPGTGITSVVPDPDSPVYKTNQAKDAKLAAQTDYLGAQEESSKAQKELRDAQTAYDKAKLDPNSLVSQQVASRLATAKQNASISAGKLAQSRLTYQARYLGTGSSGEALPGTMITDDGTPVGSAFSGNVRPTGTERNKADMANSADTQLADIKSIMQKNPTMFGPGYGQTSEFKKWIGGQSPDAQRFMAARTIAADHLAGTFGGRSEAALTALDNAIGQFKDNPEAAIAGVDQLSGANKSFMQAGAVKTTGSKAAARAATASPSSAEALPPQAASQLKEGVQHTFNNGQVWTLKAGTPTRIK